MKALFTHMMSAVRVDGSLTDLFETLVGVLPRMMHSFSYAVQCTFGSCEGISSERCRCSWNTNIKMQNIQSSFRR